MPEEKPTTDRAIVSFLAKMEEATVDEIDDGPVPSSPTCCAPPLPFQMLDSFLGVLRHTAGP